MLTLSSCQGFHCFSLAKVVLFQQLVYNSYTYINLM
jgi:hypothetical protein